MKSRFKISHKIIAVICSVVILLSAISSIAFNIFALSDADVWDGTIATEYAGGSGTAEDPYLISTPEQLALMVTTSGANTSGKYYRMTADMYLNNTNNPDWKNDNPKNWCAPEKDNFFRGNFDGNGHTVRGLYYNGSKQDAALFAGIRGTAVSIKNLAIADSSLTTTANYAAAFAGQAFNSSVSVFENCYVYDTVTVTANNYTAGFIGGGTCTSISFKNCASFANVTTAITSNNRYGSFVGGLFYNNGTGDARKITYNSCIGNIAYTNYVQYPTYTASYCAVNGTVDSSSKAYPTVVSLSNMKGESAKTNMPDLDWNTFKTANKYPILKFCTDENIGNIEDDDNQGNGDNNEDNNGEDVVYSFENWSGKSQDKSATGISFANVAKDGAKSLCYSLPSGTGNYGTPCVALLNEGINTAKAAQGTTYKLSFWYKVDGTPTNKGQFVVYTAASGGATSDSYRQLQTLDKNVIFDSDTTTVGENGWVKATVKFVADLKNENYNLVAVGVKGIGNGVVDKKIYIDSVTFEEYKQEDSNEDITYSFENWSGKSQDKSATGISFADVAKDGKKSLKYRLPDSTANYGTPRVAVLNEGWSNAKAEAGKIYELSFWYKVDGTPTNKGQFVVYTTASGGATSNEYRQLQFLDKSIIFDSDTTNSGENGWIKETVKFKAELKSEGYDLVAVGVKGIGTAAVDKDIYIDAVTIQEVKPLAEEDIIYSFENWAGNSQDKSATGISFSDVAKDGAKSLCYRLPSGTGNYAIARVALLNDGINTARAAEGTTYELSFWYKVDGTPTNKGEFVVYTAASGGATSDGYRQLQTLDKNVIFDSDTTDSGENGWVKETVTFTTELKADGYNFIAVGVKGIGSAAVDKNIYIDAVTIKTLRVSKICKITAHYNDADNTVKVISAIVGNPVSIPPVDRPGYYIQSWYTDKDLTNKFDPSKISEGKMDIYAKWAVMDGEVVCDFDSYPFIPGKGMNAACYTVANNIGVDNTKALKYATSALYTNWWNTRLAGIAIGGSSYYLNEKSLYKVSFKYFVPSKPDATINVNIWAANKENIGDTTNAHQQDVSETLIINDKTPTGKWLTYTASFTAELYNPTIDSSTTNDTLTGLNLLALGVVTGEKVSTNAIVYFDNFKVENIKAEAQTTITAHTKGSSKTQVFKGVAGHTLVEPPVRKDYIFEGWYSDAELKKPVKVAVFPESGNLDLYVKWKRFKNGDSITIGFDDYTYVSGSKQFYPWYSLDKTDSADSDGVSVRATMDSGCSTTMRLAYKGYPVLIEDGSRYLVSFSYKNIDEVPNKWSVRIYANSPLNCGVGTTQQSSEDDAYRLTLSRAAGFGTWKRHTYSFTASLKYPGHNALAINMQTNSFSEVKEIRALIDSVTIKRIAADDIVCMTNTLSGPDYVIGKKDEKIVLPDNLKLNGYKFLGWFMDKNFGLEVADALFSEDTVFYAKWARVKLSQDFEAYNYQGYGIGYDLDIEYYNNKVAGYTSKNVYSGKSSIHRIGKVSSDKKFTLITDANDKIAIGETYKVTYYVKLASTKNKNQNIYVLPTDSYFYPGACDTDMAIPSVSLENLYPGVWYKITNIVTLYSPYLAVKTPALSDIYFDNFTLELVTSDTTIDESEKVIPLGKVPVNTNGNEEFYDTEFDDTLPDIPIVEDGIVEEEIIEDGVEENVVGNDENAPQKNEAGNNHSDEESSNNTVVILVISILAAVLVVAAILVAIYLRKRKQK